MGRRHWTGESARTSRAGRRRAGFGARVELLEGRTLLSMTVVKNGMMYFTAPPNVVKIDARTGQTVWRSTTAAAGPARSGSAGLTPLNPVTSSMPANHCTVARRMIAVLWRQQCI